MGSAVAERPAGGQHHWFTQDGLPEGGHSWGCGFTIAWQRGPVQDGDEPNGARVEDVLQAVLDRLELYQESRLACPENALAVDYIGKALTALAARTADREARGVEGTYGE